MATKEQVARLLTVRCDWCGAARGEHCYLPSEKFKRHRRRLKALDGGQHHSRWQAVFGHDADVIASALPEGRFRRDPAPVDRPW